MHLLRYAVEPSALATREKYAGALVNCYLNIASRQEAEEAAHRMIQENGWAIRYLDEASSAEAKDFEPNSEARRCIEQARTDTIVLVFHTYPANDSTNDDEKA